MVIDWIQSIIIGVDWTPTPTKCDYIVKKLLSLYKDHSYLLSIIDLSISKKKNKIKIINSFDFTHFLGSKVFPLMSF